jgi:hypothetical protein
MGYPLLNLAAIQCQSSGKLTAGQALAKARLVLAAGV